MKVYKLYLWGGELRAYPAGCIVHGDNSKVNVFVPSECEWYNDRGFPINFDKSHLLVKTQSNYWEFWNNTWSKNYVL